MYFNYQFMSFNILLHCKINDREGTEGIRFVIDGSSVRLKLKLISPHLWSAYRNDCFDYVFVLITVLHVLQGSDITKQKAVLTDEREDIECGLVIRSIGYKGTLLDQSVPFDEQQGIIQNQRGRVTGQPGRV